MAPEGKLCWVEIPVRNDLAKLKEFYAGAFPTWIFKPSEQMPEVILWEDGKGQHGGLVTMPAGCSKADQAMGAGFTVYYFVDSIEEATERIEKLGGKTVLPKVSMGKSFYSNLIDIEGNRFGIFQVGEGEGEM